MHTLIRFVPGTATKVTVTRNSSQFPPDTYDMYDVRFGDLEDTYSARLIMHSASMREDVKATVADLCQEIYERLISPPPKRTQQEEDRAYDLTLRRIADGGSPLGP